MPAIFTPVTPKSSLLPQDPLGERLCELFPYLWNTITAPNEVKPEWETLTKYPLRPRVLWQSWQDQATLVGVRFGSNTRYGMLDIDDQSPYHPNQDPEALVTLRAALETIGIYRTILITSSDSGGLHLYLPLPELVPTFGLASALKQCVEAQGFTVTAGKLEIFPNTKAYGIKGEFIEYNAHRLPLQPAAGSFLLDADGNPIGNDLRQFLTTWDWAADGQSLPEVKTAITIARKNGNKRRRRRLTIVADWHQDLQTEINEGWTGYGQTNALLKAIACYGVVFERLTGDALAEFVQLTAMNAPGYADWCRHQHEITQRAIVWARAAEKYYWALGTTSKRESNFTTAQTDHTLIPTNKNVQRALDAQRRIREAMERLSVAGQLPDAVTSRKKVLEQQGISAKTLYKYPELWHPEHQDAAPEHQDAAPANPDIECKSVQLEGNPADFATPIAADVKSPEPLQTEKIYTLEKIMKCDWLFFRTEYNYLGLPIGFRFGLIELVILFLLFIQNSSLFWAIVCLSFLSILRDQKNRSPKAAFSLVLGFRSSCQLHESVGPPIMKYWVLLLGRQEPPSFS
jgi:hypothetical protein